MSAFGGKADVNHCVAECPLIAISGHPELFGRFRRTVLSPAIPRRPVGGEPLGLGDLCRGHLIGEGVFREPRPAVPTGGGEAVPHVGADTIRLRETRVGPIPTVLSSLKVSELLLGENIALVGGETQPRQAFSIRLVTPVKFVKLELGFRMPLVGREA